VFQCKDSDDVAGWCDYGGTFAAMVAKDNMIGTQFHPEKSQQAGLDLIKGFLRWKP
jgi:glutamine amidotransferase